MGRNSGPVAIIGCGVMGTGIAAVAVGHGIDVTLIDNDEDALKSAEARVDRALRHGQLLTAFPAQCVPGRIDIDDSLSSIGKCRAIIEAVNEDQATKLGILCEVERHTLVESPIITNTSGIPVETIAAGLRDPSRLIGVHFMNPAYIINMVEVVKGSRTAERTALLTHQILSAMNRRPIMVHDSPGFVTSRLLHSMINDAACLVGEKVATAEQVDLLMQGCLGHPTGPLHTADLIGLDNLVDSLRVLFERTNDNRYRPSAILLDLVEKGHLGQKTGKGFFEYGGV